ncbi:SMC-Scp complex subunit ScpB [Microbaculum marinum]|uniref:SMC-Scp complex subunit ScpB n=1 Tax=Microbaculum marinum TaxID=1764581 RepID=A0AAW9S0E2_9HYPH
MSDNGNNVANFTPSDRREQLRMLEALLFAASEPLDVATMTSRLPKGADIATLLTELQGAYANRGVNLVKVDEKWRFRTAEDLSFLLRRDAVDQRQLSRAALETLAIIAYHQPTTRAEIEEIRGVSISKGVLDVLMEAGWIRMRGRRRTPGRPVTYGTTPEFLDHFGLESLRDLPGVEELKGAGLLDSRLPAGFEVPTPAGEELTEDEDPLDLLDGMTSDDEATSEGISDEETAGGTDR